jgi:universal stress protein A
MEQRTGGLLGAIDVRHLRERLATQAPSHAPPGWRRRDAGRGHSPHRPDASPGIKHGVKTVDTTDDGRPARIVVAVDDTAAAREALRVAESLARRSGATIVLLHVARPRWSSFDLGPAVLGAFARSTADAWALLGRARRALGAHIPATAEVLHGKPGPAIARRAAELGAELLVVGSHGRGGLERWLFGSTSDDILRRASCPVVVVPAVDAAGPGE